MLLFEALTGVRAFCGTHPVYYTYPECHRLFGHLGDTVDETHATMGLQPDSVHDTPVSITVRPLPLLLACLHDP